MKFVLSYSCGKDSTLALHKMLEQGHEPVGLLVMVNQEAGRSWFHGVDPELLEEISRSLDIPLIPCPSTGEEYHLVMEEGLCRAKELGAQAAVFGDIDIEEHAQWCRGRCEAAGLEGVFPLWQRDRKENAREILALGYQCVMKCVRNDARPQEMLGKVLDDSLLRQMESLGIDVCGENGEYHTIVLGGPIFHTPVPYTCGEILDFGNISAMDIRLAKE